MNERTTIWSRGSRTGGQGMETFPDASQRLTEEIVQITRQHPKPMPPKRRDTSLPEPKVEGPEQVSPATRLWKRQIDCEGDDDD